MSSPRSTPLEAIRWLVAKNNSSSEEIPAFGLVRVVSCDSEGILTVAQPNANSQDVYVNGPVPIPASGYGAVTRDHPVYALYETSDGTPALGEAWGAANGSYKLRKNSSQTGWIIEGGHTSGRVLARRKACDCRVCLNCAPATLTATIFCPPCACLDGATGTLTWSEAASEWSGTLTVPCTTGCTAFLITLLCSGVPPGDLLLDVQWGACLNGSILQPDPTCNPFYTEWQTTLELCDCAIAECLGGSGLLTITVTE